MSHASGGKFMIRIVLYVVVLAILAVGWMTLNQLKEHERPVRVALVTADEDPYWKRLIQGAQSAAESGNIQLTVKTADGSSTGQDQILNELIDEGYDGIAVSPVDANRQALLLRRVGRAARLVTVDSDCELSGRLCFIGVDNYAAGRLCGEMIKQAMPGGGRVVIVVGPLTKDNGERRRQGIIDELLDRSYGPGRPTEPLDEEHRGERFVVAATLVDSIDSDEAKQNVMDALSADPEINCVVGLFAYSAPAALAAVEEMGAGDRVTIVGFDDRAETLDAIAAGGMYATIVQDQYSYGHEAITMLAGAVRGMEDISIPITERVHYPPVTVTAENVESFRAGQPVVQ